MLSLCVERRGYITKHDNAPPAKHEHESPSIAMSGLTRRLGEQVLIDVDGNVTTQKRIGGGHSACV